MDLQLILAWVMDHWSGMAEVAGAIHLLAVAIINLTDTPVEGTFQHHYYRQVERVAGLVTEKAKQ